MAKKKTPYGLDAYRKPYFKGEFRYPQGSKQEAVILDIDGCIIDWGDAANLTLRTWAKKHYDAGRALLVMTARDQGMFTSSFNTLMRVLPFPFIGPFCRRNDDPRYAPEFKRETAEWLSEQYDIVGAADDSPYVNTMYEWWAKEYFEDPADFDHLKTSYTKREEWTRNLPPKEYPRQAAITSSATAPYSSYYGGGAATPHRAAGTRDFTPWWEDTHKDPWYDRASKEGDVLDVEIIGNSFAEEVGS